MHSCQSDLFTLTVHHLMDSFVFTVQFFRNYRKLEMLTRKTYIGNSKNISAQECIPVGCVPSAAVAVSRVGGCLLPGGVYSRGGGVCLLGGLLPGGGLFCGGGCGIPACTEAATPCGQTHACKNITFATLLRTVKIYKKPLVFYSMPS